MAGLSLPLLAPPAAAASGAPAGPAPVIEVQKTTQDGGTVEEGTLLKYHFVVANRGKADLELTQVKPSCGCTVPHWDKVIPPGKEGAIDAEVRTIGFRGPILKHLTVISNDPERPQLDLSLTAQITPLVQINPGTVALLSVDDQPVRQVFTLERTGGRPMQILQVVAGQPYVKTELTPLSGPGRFQIAAIITAEAPWGRTTTPVIVRTDLKEAPNLTLTLIVDRGIVATPMVLFFQAPPGPLPAPQQVIATLAREKKPFHVKGATVDDPKLQAKVEPVREGSEYRVIVSYSGGWEAGVVQKMLTVTTDDPKQPELKLPISAMVGAARAFPQPPAIAR